MLHLSERIQSRSQSILEYTEIQLNLSTMATLGTEESRHCSEVAAVEKKPKHKLARKQQAIATTLCEDLQASNCVYKSRGAPARGIGPPQL